MAALEAAAVEVEVEAEVEAEAEVGVEEVEVVEEEKENASRKRESLGSWASGTSSSTRKSYQSYRCLHTLWIATLSNMVPHTRR